jgi:hypothetical protein
MFSELPENVAVDLRSGLGDFNGQLDFLCHHHRRSNRQKDESEADKK